ncbi:MAG: hypothetical protein V7745_05775 [Pseudomonadales bacterium]
MKHTLIIQSHRTPLPFDWLQECIESVQTWAADSGFNYQWLGDEIFDSLDAELIEKTETQKVIASDLARLKVIKQALRNGYQRVIWCDADFLIFNPQQFILPESSFALGREVWVQEDNNNRLRAYTKVHNAFMMFCCGNHFLDYYTASAEQLLRANQGRMPPQFIGPKLLTALHNMIECPIMETAGMLSPLVIRDILKGDGQALSLFKKKSPSFPAGANLCSSVTASEGFNDMEMQCLIEKLKCGI